MATTGQSRLASTRDRTAVALIVTGLISVLTLGTAFALLALGVEFFWIAFPVGFGAVLPLALGVVMLRTAADG